ncbi:MAG TPA: ATP-binding protein [Gemmatimonadales bacterium]|nr:ATP-binding protein [Gemmatimonadales bacterium]
MSRPGSGPFERVDVPPAEIVRRLKAHRTLGGVPEQELAWLAAHGIVRRFEKSARFVAAGEADGTVYRAVEGVHAILSGHLAIYVDRGEGRHKVMEWRGGDVSGLLPYSRMKASPGDVIFEERSEVLTVYREHFPEMMRECPEVTAALVHVMLDRARHFTSSDLHDEKMKSLGKLAAGLAHELNNPASAVIRAAKSLSEGLSASDAASRALGAAGLTPAQRAAVEAVRDACLARRRSGAHSPIEEADRADAIADWVQSHGADGAVAGPLADTAVTIPALDELARSLDGPLLDGALRWVAYGCAARTLAREIEAAASRIHEIVAAVKGFTQMDRETVAQPIDVERGLADTLTVLRSKVKRKSATVEVAVEPDLPRVEGYGGELNQVWVNLIDNALDAVNPGGRLDVSVKREAGRVVVRVADDGPGIPESIRGSIFDPFFTTKPVGEGTGLGLDIVRRLVSRNNGTIEVESRPGRTVFTVGLPAAGAPSAGS